MIDSFQDHVMLTEKGHNEILQTQGNSIGEVESQLYLETQPNDFDQITQECCSLEIMVKSMVLDPQLPSLKPRKYIYRLKFSDVNRFSDENSPSKVIRWEERERSTHLHNLSPSSKSLRQTHSKPYTTLHDMKQKQIKIPFKFKYLKQDIIFEVSSCLDNRQQGPDDLRNIETLLYRATF